MSNAVHIAAKPAKHCAADIYIRRSESTVFSGHARLEFSAGPCFVQTYITVDELRKLAQVALAMADEMEPCKVAP